MNAEFFSFDISINYRCPSCNLFFRLTNGQIPTSKGISVICDGCGNNLTVKPVSLSVKDEGAKASKVEERPSTNVDHRTINSAYKSLVSLGWSKKEAIKMTSSLPLDTYSRSTTVEELVREAIANVR